jgi:hypothetical protein
VDFRSWADRRPRYGIGERFEVEAIGEDAIGTCAQLECADVDPRAR